MVDDDSEDRLLTKNAFEENAFFNKVETAEDSEALIAYLRNPGSTIDLNNLMILLDLRMPRENGLQVLRFLKNNDQYRHIPVIIYTGTNNRLEVASCYDLGATACVLKPHDYKEIIDLGKALKTFWVSKSTQLNNYIDVL